MKSELRFTLVVAAFITMVVAFFLALPTPDATAGNDNVPLPEGHFFAITNVRVFDGRDVIDTATVVVRDGRIESVTPGGSVPASVATVDGRGRTLLPGLVDAHTHTWGRALLDSARFGVTTSLDMFTDKSFAAEKRRRRDSFERTSEADLFSAGTLVTAKGGHGTEYGLPIPTLDDPGHAAEFVRQRIEEGSDYVKIVLDSGEAWGMETPTLGAARLAAVIRAAHDEKRLALVHVSTLEDARLALTAGADGLIHTFGDREADDEFLELATSSGAFVVSTIGLLDSLDRPEGDHPLLSDEPLARLLSSEQQTSLRRRFPFTGRHASHAATAVENLRRLHEAGVPILAGTDAPNPGTAHGVSLHDELARLVDAGLTPVEALRSATSLPSERFSLEGRGCIAAGCRADLVLVAGDPTTTITDTRRIDAVWKNGFRIERELATAERRPALEAGELVSDFDAGEVDSLFGSGWIATTDQMMNGKSTAVLTLAPEGASATAGALRVDGEIAKGFPFAWAGAMFFPGQAPMEPVDASSRGELVFWVRSDQKELRVMAFAESLSTRPAEVRIATSSTWTEVRVSFADFSGLDPAGLRAFAICAGPAPGTFHFEIDDVRLR